VWQRYGTLFFAVLTTAREEHLLRFKGQTNTPSGVELDFIDSSACLNDIITFKPMKYQVQWEDQFNKWHQYQTMNHLPNAIRTAKSRFNSTGKRHRITDEKGNLIDIIQ